MKKLISLLLIVAMLTAMAIPALTASAIEEYPIIYVQGFGGAIYTDNDHPSSENQIYPTGADVGALISEAIAPCLTKLAGAVATGNYDAYCDELYNAVAPIYDELRLDANGEASDGSGWGGNMLSKPLPKKTGSYNMNDYRFSYDWRLAPTVLAETLKAHIDRVKEATGKDKVNLVGRCLGANIVAAYLTKYEDHALENTNTVVMYMPSAMGIELIGNIFSGNIVLKDDNVNTFADYYMSHNDLFEDEGTSEFITAFIALLNQVKVLGFGTDVIQSIIDNVKDNLVPRLVRDTYGSFPSFWAMCDGAHYEEARDFSFAGKEEEYAKMIEKLDDYYYNVQTKLYDTLDTLEANGIYTSVVAKYNLPAIPVYENSLENSDTFTTTKLASFGATTTDYGKILSDEHIAGMSDEDILYLSPDQKIDASTCHIPERTWFIKNMTHAAVPDCMDEFILTLCRGNGEITVFDNPDYPQYLDYDAEKNILSPVTGLDEHADQKTEEDEEISVFVRFIRVILSFVLKLFGIELAPGV